MEDQIFVNYHRKYQERVFWRGQQALNYLSNRLYLWYKHTTHSPTIIHTYINNEHFQQESLIFTPFDPLAIAARGISRIQNILDYKDQSNLSLPSLSSHMMLLTFSILLYLITSCSKNTRNVQTTVRYIVPYPLLDRKKITPVQEIATKGNGVTQQNSSLFTSQ